MDPFNPNDTNPLRSTDLMIAYLEDRAGEEDILKIESLLESDELYRLSMEELADQIADNRELAKSRIEKTELGFEEALEAAKTNFIKQLEQTAANGSSDHREAPGPAMPWWSYVIAIALVGVLAWAFLRGDKQTELHKNPLENLVASTDQATLSNFLQDCGEDNLGIGRPQAGNTVNVYSALVDQYAEGNYNASASQFEQLSKKLTHPCAAYAAFYKGQSYLAVKDLDKAEKSFEEVLTNTEDLPELRHATLWYLANVQLVKGENEEAKKYFESLEKSDKEEKNVHIKELTDKGYLLDTQKYLNEL